LAITVSLEIEIQKKSSFLCIQIRPDPKIMTRLEPTLPDTFAIETILSRDK